MLARRVAVVWSATPEPASACRPGRREQLCRDDFQEFVSGDHLTVAGGQEIDYREPVIAGGQLVIRGRAIADGEEDPGRQADIDRFPDPAGQGKVVSAVARRWQGVGGARRTLGETVAGWLGQRVRF